MRKGLLRAGLAAGVVGLFVLAPSRVAGAGDCTELPGARVGQCESTTTTTTSTTSPTSTQPSSEDEQSRGPAGPDHAAVRRLAALVNDERSRAGVPPLAMNVDIERIASDHSTAMASEARIWHNDDYFSSDTRAALGARALGENVALNGDADDAHARLMASSGHRANILDARFTHLGIGAVRDAEGILYITQDFAQISQTSQTSQISAPAAAGPPPSSAAIAPPAPVPSTAPSAVTARTAPDSRPESVVLAAGDALHAPHPPAPPAEGQQRPAPRPRRHEEGVAGAVMAIAAVGLCDRAGRRAAPFLFKSPSAFKRVPRGEGIRPIGPKF